MNRREVLDEVKSVLEQLDNLAQVWGDEGVFRRCRDRLRVLAETPCAHENETAHREGQLLGTVACDDCGRKRDWSAY